MKLTVALQAGTLLANVRYEWIVSGVAGSPLSTGIVQPGSNAVFVITATVPVGAEEMIVYDNTDVGNWNVAGYALLAFVAAPPAPGTGLTSISPDLTQLKLIVAAYCHVAPSELTVNGIDLFLLAANNARKKAERKHDFEYSRVVATLALTAAGADLSDATIVEGVATAGIKTVTEVRRLGTNGFYFPLDFSRHDVMVERERREIGLGYSYSQNRYPSDSELLQVGGTTTSIVQRGRMIFAYPGFIASDPSSVTLTLDGFGWLPNYGKDGDVDDPEDFIVEFGLDYLQYAILCELNYLFKMFVPRQEGNLSPPTAERDEELQRLIIEDCYRLDAHQTSNV